MAWYPGAVRLELQPESDSQEPIVPTQFIMHSIAAPWTKERIFEYWRDSSNLESHFGQSYDGSIAQYIGTETRADANYLANRRPDGTGAVSIETASNLQHSDPWTPEQMGGLIALGAWLHQQHGIPLRVCRASDGPGYGYHRLYADWSLGGTACPGDARVSQFHDVVFPGIVARVTTPPPPEENSDMPNMLNSPNPTDAVLQSGQWTGLAFGEDRPNGPAVIHGAGWRHDTQVKVFLDRAAHADTKVQGRFYNVDPDGINGKSGYLEEDFAGGGGHTFTCSGDVPTGKHLRFELKVTTPDGSPVTLMHRLATGPYWAL